MHRGYGVGETVLRHHGKAVGLRLGEHGVGNDDDERRARTDRLLDAGEQRFRRNAKSSSQRLATVLVRWVTVGPAAVAASGFLPKNFFMTPALCRLSIRHGIRICFIGA